MKKFIIVLLAIVFLIGCATAKAQQPGKLSSDPKPKLIASEVAVILQAAMLDIENLGCESEFLSERGAFIWVRCYDKKEKPVMKVYQLQKLIDGYVKQKNKEGERP